MHYQLLRNIKFSNPQRRRFAVGYAHSAACTFLRNSYSDERLEEYKTSFNTVYTEPRERSRWFDSPHAYLW